MGSPHLPALDAGVDRGRALVLAGLRQDDQHADGGRGRKNQSGRAEYSSAGTIAPLTYHAIIELLATTGKRRTEAGGLRMADSATDGLEVRNANLGKAGLMHLHSTVDRALDSYLEMQGPGAPDGPPSSLKPDGDLNSGCPEACVH